MVRTCRFYPARASASESARAPDEYAAWCVDSLPSTASSERRLLPAADEACGLVVVGTGYCR